MPRNWTDTLNDRNAGLVPGFLPGDVPLELHDELATVDAPYLEGTAAAGDPSPREARADAIADAADHSPNVAGVALADMSKAQLIEVAQKAGLTVDPRGTKSDLITAIEAL